MGAPPAAVFAELPIAAVCHVQWTGNNNDNRDIPVVDDRDGQSFEPDFVQTKRITAAGGADHFVSGWYLNSGYGCSIFDQSDAAVQSYIGSDGNAYFQGISTTNIRLGSSGSDAKGSNASGVTYEALAIKYGVKA